MQPTNKALGFTMGFKYSIAASQLFDFTDRHHCSPINGLKFEKADPRPHPTPRGAWALSICRRARGRIPSTHTPPNLDVSSLLPLKSDC
jgi:hypothetical protein